MSVLVICLFQDMYFFHLSCHICLYVTSKHWCWEGLGAGVEGDDRGWDGWMASPTQQSWVWVNSGSWWWTGRPGVLQFMGSQRVGHDWATELNWIEHLNKDDTTQTYLWVRPSSWLHNCVTRRNLIRYLGEEPWHLQPDEREGGREQCVQKMWLNWWIQ